MRTLITMSFGLLAMLAANTSATAQVIYTNAISGPNPSATRPYVAGQVTDPNLTGSGIDFGPANSAVATPDAFVANGFNTIVITTSYFEIKFAANAGYEVDLSQLSFNATVGLNGPLYYEVRSSVDGFFAVIQNGDAINGTIFVNLSGPEFQNLTGPVTLRIYPSEAPSATGSYAINNFTVLGAVPAQPSLPLTLMSFSGHKDKHNLKLSWTSTCEVDLLSYELERSVNGRSFDRIAAFPANNSGCTQLENYSYNDADIQTTGSYQYRLRINELDGTSSYSAVRSFRHIQEGVAPQLTTVNPVKHNLQILGTSAGDQISIYDMNGRNLKSWTATGADGTDVSSLHAGLYILKVNNAGSVRTVRFSKL